MNSCSWRLIAAAALAVLCLPAAAFAQSTGTKAVLKPRDERAPIPPGVPTSPDNVHLPTEGEVKLGRQDAAEVERKFKILTSGPYYDRLQRVSRDVVAALQRSDIIREYKRVYHLPRKEDHSKRVPFEFSFKVVDDPKIVNAFSLAGGPIYVFRGLMDYAISDNELAGVLAHECTHVAYHHVEQYLRKQKKQAPLQVAGLLAAIAAGAAGGSQGAAAATNLMLGAQLISIAAINGYGRELETEADRVAVLALQGTQYNPIGVMTFMQKLQTEDRLHGNPDFGIYQSHPFTNERVNALKKQLEALGYKTDPGTLRQVSGSIRFETVADRHNGHDITELKLNGKTMFVVAAGEGSDTPAERAQRIVQQLQELFNTNVTVNDVTQSADKRRVLVRGVPVIQVLPEDAAVLGSVTEVSDRAYQAILGALWKEKLNIVK